MLGHAPHHHIEGPALDPVQLRDRLKNHLKAQGYRLTPERLKVFDAVNAQAGLFTADELFLELGMRGDKISRATIYNTLAILETFGLVYKTRLNEGPLQYESASGGGRHDYLVCTHCGCIMEFVDSQIEETNKTVAERFDFTLLGHSNEVLGLCSDCVGIQHLRPLKRVGIKNERTKYHE